MNDLFIGDEMIHENQIDFKKLDHELISALIIDIKDYRRGNLKYFDKAGNFNYLTLSAEIYKILSYYNEDLYYNININNLSHYISDRSHDYEITKCRR